MRTTTPWPRIGRASIRQIMIWLSAVVAALLPGVALAHTGVGVAGGFLSGFTHPIFGFDHVVAMSRSACGGRFSGSPRSGSCRSCSPW